jgi:hypothetical protein
MPAGEMPLQVADALARCPIIRPVRPLVVVPNNERVAVALAICSNASTVTGAVRWARRARLRKANCRLGLGRGAGSSGDPIGQALLRMRDATPSKIRLRPNWKSS